MALKSKEKDGLWTGFRLANFQHLSRRDYRQCQKVGIFVLQEEQRGGIIGPRVMG